MKKVSVLLFLFVMLVIAGAAFIQQNDIEKKAIMAVIEEETAAWYASDFERWAATYVNTPDFLGMGSSKNGFTLNDGWEKVANSTSVRTKRQTVKEEKIPIRIKVYDETAWVVFKNIYYNEKGEGTLTQIVTAFLEKNAGKWKMTYRNALSPLTYHQADMGSLFMISYGKSLGKSIDEMSAYAGNLVKMNWNQAGGIKTFINGSISNWKSQCYAENFKVLEQDENHAVYTVEKIYPGLKASGKSYGVTYDEYLAFMNGAYQKIADYMGASYKQENTTEGIKVTVTKK